MVWLIRETSIDWLRLNWAEVDHRWQGPLPIFFFFLLLSQWQQGVGKGRRGGGVPAVRWFCQDLCSGVVEQWSEGLIRWQVAAGLEQQVAVGCWSQMNGGGGTGLSQRCRGWDLRPMMLDSSPSSSSSSPSFGSVLVLGSSSESSGIAPPAIWLSSPAIWQRVAAFSVETFQ